MEKNQNNILFILACASTIIVGLSFFAESKFVNSKSPETVQDNRPKPYLTASTSPTLTASSFASYLYNPKTEKFTTLIEEQATTSLPIASITKLITAAVALEEIPKERQIFITDVALNQYEKAGGLVAAQEYTAENLLKATLIESSNDAAYALAEDFGISRFIQKMNDKAKSLGLTETKFVNSSGVDERRTENRSSAYDLSRIIGLLLKQHPEIFPVLMTKEATIQAVDGSSSHTLVNTDILLSQTDFPLEIIGGKTGETPRAKQTLVLITKTPNTEENLADNVIIHAVLNSQDRFADMENLVRWTKESYVWK